MPLMPHQVTGASFLAERGFAFLWDDMGLGKTVSVVAGADKVGARKILVICPAVVRRHWEATFLEWQTVDREVNVIDGFVSVIPGSGVTIVSHACIANVAPPAGNRQKRRDVYSLPMLQAGGPYDLIVLDEAHEFRDYDAIRARNFWMPDGLWERSHRVWALTGTPVVNSAADLFLPAYGPMRTPISWWDWCNTYADMRPDAYQGMKPVGVKDPVGLADFLRPHVLRRTIESIGMQLPPLHVVPRMVEIPADALQQAMADLDGWSPQRVMAAIEAGDELKDAALARVRRALGIAKAPYAAAHVHNLLASGEGPVVLFFQHTDVRKAIYETLNRAGYVVSWIDGKVTRTQLQAAKDWFQAGRLDVLLVQTQAGGIGLTLTQAHRAAIAELPWTDVALRQAIKRIHRIGQGVACTAEILRVSGSWLDEALAATVAKKQRAADSLLSLLISAK